MSALPQQAARLAYQFEEGMCQQLGLGRTAAYKALSEGHVETYTVGRRRFVTHAALLDFVDRMKKAAGAAS